MLWPHHSQVTLQNNQLVHAIFLKRKYMYIYIYYIMFLFLVDLYLKTGDWDCIQYPSAAGSHAWMFHAVMAMAMTSMMPDLEDLNFNGNFTEANGKSWQLLVGYTGYKGLRCAKFTYDIPGRVSISSLTPQFLRGRSNAHLYIPPSSYSPDVL